MRAKVKSSVAYTSSVSDKQLITPAIEPPPDPARSTAPARSPSASSKNSRRSFAGVPLPPSYVSEDRSRVCSSWPWKVWVKQWVRPSLFPSAEFPQAVVLKGGGMGVVPNIAPRRPFRVSEFSISDVLSHFMTVEVQILRGRRKLAGCYPPQAVNHSGVPWISFKARQMTLHHADSSGRDPYTLSGKRKDGPA